MINTVDHVIVAVENLAEAENDYKTILGIEPSWRGTHVDWGTSNSLFNFDNTYLELLAATGEGMGAQFVRQKIKQNGEGLLGIVLGTNELDAVRDKILSLNYFLPNSTEGVGTNNDNSSKRIWVSQFLPSELSRGLFSFIIQHKEGNLPKAETNEDSHINRLDHIVIKTNEADSFIKIYKDIYGIRLALDKFVEAWKRRMLFFRVNKTTIEVIEEKDDQDKPHDMLWGLAWGVDDINNTRDRLIKNGIEISEIKNGVKENTLVATIKSNTRGVPTLLIQQENV